MAITVMYAPEFVRLYEKLDPALKEEVKEKIVLFKDRSNHKTLKVHKLHGRLRGRQSFSVNYKFRIVFEYISKDVAVLKTIGDHDVYK